MNNRILIFIIPALIICLLLFRGYYIHIVPQIESGNFNKPSEMKYLLYSPKDTSTPRPLIVLLHGAGERGSDNTKPINIVTLKRVSDLSKKYNAYIFIPQCRKNGNWVLKETPNFNNYNTFKMPRNVDIEVLEKSIEQIIDNYTIDTSRVYAMGHSMGGAASIILSVRNPDIFTAIAPISCSTDPYNAYRIKGMPFFYSIGDQDQYFSIEQIDSMIVNLKKAGNTHTKLNILQNKGHGIYKDILNNDEIFDWLLSFKKPVKQKTNE